MNLLIGFAKDIHALNKNKNRPLILGGAILDDSLYKIKAHSDGDIILHAIANAILNVLGIDDIGSLFPDEDLKNKNISSKLILTSALEKLNQTNYIINNISLTIVCNYIMINKYKNIILFHLKELLNVDQISLCGTRFEKRSKMIECYCIILFKK